MDKCAVVWSLTIDKFISVKFLDDFVDFEFKILQFTDDEKLKSSLSLDFVLELLIVLTANEQLITL